MLCPYCAPQSEVWIPYGKQIGSYGGLIPCEDSSTGQRRFAIPTPTCSVDVGVPICPCLNLFT